MEKTDQSRTDNTDCEECRGRAALKKNRCYDTHKKTVKRIFYGKLDICPHSCAKNLLHVCAEFQHSEQEKGKTGYEKKKPVNHSVNRIRESDG